MCFLDELRLLQGVHNLIRIKGTGSVKDLSRRYGVSRRTILRKIETLRNLGAEITFCKHRQTYMYKENFELNLESVIF